MTESYVQASGKRLAKVSALLAGVVACLGSCMLVLHSYARSKCWEAGRDIPSPSGHYLARVSSSGCPGLGGDSGLMFSVTLRNAGEPVSEEHSIFSEDMIGQAPDVSWSNDDKLAVIIKNVSNVHLSKNNSHAIRILYKAPFDYSIEHSRKADERLAYDAAVNLPTSVHTTEQYEDWLRKALVPSREMDKRFYEWAVRTVTP